MSSTPKISAAIITLNEEENIGDCLRNLKDICDEIVVVDSFSTDRTVEIAKELGAKIVHQKYLGDGPQKQIATENASNNWVLSIDADERLDEDAKDAIRTLKFEDPEIGYSFKRKNFVGKSWIKASDFYPDRKVRLYNKEHSRYDQKKGHSFVISPREEKLDAHIIHFTYKDYAHWIRNSNFLSSRDAWAKRDMKVNLFTAVYHGWWTFVRKYFLKGGIWHGKDGLTVSCFAAYFNFVKYLKVMELQKENKDKAFEPHELR